MGWVVLGIIALLGNLYLFSGYNVEGGLAEFMVGVGLLFDVFLIYFIGKMIYAKIQSNIQEEKARRTALENQRIADLKNRISQIADRYKPKEILWVPMGDPISIKPELINQDVVVSVRQYKRNISDLIGRYRKIGSCISGVMECSGIESLEHQFEYLRMNESKLSQLKCESDQIYRDIISRKVQLLNEDTYVLNVLHKAFDLLKASKKCISDKMNISDFIVDKKPEELGIFSYQCDPIVLCVNSVYFCLFSRVILVFDANGRFSTALDPTAISISVTRRTDSVYISGSTNSIYHKYIDTDSKKVQEGQTTSHWLYSNKDGSPDLRRSHNPLIQSRTDVYEYGVVTISVAGTSIAFTVSSQAAIERLPYAGIEYAQKYNHLHNPTTDFIGLLKLLLGSGHDGIACELEKAYGRMKQSENYFCKEVTTSC